MNWAILLLATLGHILPQPVVSGNFPRDLYGDVDTRNLTWGHADSATLDIQFYPPAGYGVVITGLKGDLIAFPRIDDETTILKPNRYAGVLMGFWATGSDPYQCAFCAPGYLLYIQDSISTAVDKTRAPYNYQTAQVLGPDHVLHLKIAEYLNTMGVPIHVEGTYTIEFFWFEKGRK